MNFASIGPSVWVADKQPTAVQEKTFAINGHWIMGSFLKKRSYIKNGPSVPALRGYFHVVGTYLVILTLPVLVALVPGKLAKMGVTLALGMKAFLFFVSAIGHTTEFQTMEIHDRVFAVDHANIFVSMVSDLTALHACRCDSQISLGPIIAAWMCAFLLALKILYVGRTMNKGVQVSLIIIMTAMMVNATANLNLSTKQLLLYLVLIVIGLGGSFVWALESPNPIKGVLEHHEVLHILSLVFLAVKLVLFLDAATNK